MKREKGKMRTLSDCPPSQAPQSLTPDLRLPLKGEEEKPKKVIALDLSCSALLRKRPCFAEAERTLDIRHSSDNYAKSVKNGVICENEMSGKSCTFAVRLRDASISDETDTSFSTRSARDLTASLLPLDNVQTSLTLLSLTRRLVECLRCKASLTRLENHSLLALLENTWRVCSRSTN